MDPTPRLACQQCKRRKIRCDKGAPCAACHAAGLRCHAVQRARLPRGKSGKTRNKNSLLETRLSRIEEMLSRQAEAHSSLRPPNENAGLEDPVRPGHWIGELVAPEFWATLSEEVQGLRETLEGSEDEDEQGPDEASSDHHLGAGAIVFRQSSHQDHILILPVPTARMRATLLDLFRERVDKLYKILHWPTTRSAIEATYATPEIKLSRSEKALEYAVYFIALCTLTNNEEAKALGLDNRYQLISQYRAAVEVLLARTSLLVRPDITVVQAFTMYLMALRNQVNGGLIWSLTALAIRAAESLRLGEEDPKAFSPFELELRRRLLFVIGTIDTFAALDRGTSPKMPLSLFNTPPLDINDEEMSPTYTPATSSSYFTDMSFATMIHEAMVAQREMFELGRDKRLGWEVWDKKLEILNAWEQSAEQRLGGIRDVSPPIRRFQKHIAHLVTVSLRFMARRPPDQPANEVVPPWDDFDVMAVAAEVLRENLVISKSPDFAPWAWKACVPWSALAIVLIELCCRPWGPASDRVYTIAVESYGDTARTIPDSQAGMLWKPISKLMRKVERVKNDVTRTRISKVVDRHSSSSESSEAQERLHGMAVTGIQDRTWEFGQEFEVDHSGISNMTLEGGTDYTDEMLNDIQVDLDASWLSWDHFVPTLN